MTGAPLAMAPQDVVKALYAYVLGRPANAEDIAYWSSQILEHRDASILLKVILDSEEFRMRRRVVLRQPSLETPQLLQKVIFLHNPKAAGSAVGGAIQDHAGALTVSPPLPDTFGRHWELNGAYSALRGFDIYLGHVGRDILEAVNNGHALITNSRDPVARVVSLYNYFRYRVPADYIDTSTPASRMSYACVLAAQSMVFDEFVKCENPFVRMYISDFHFRQLTHSPWEAARPGATLADAKAFVDRMTCIYVCEEPVRSERILRDRLGITAVGRENVGINAPDSARLEDVSTQTVKRIRYMNQRDIALHDYALNWILKA